MNSGDSQHLFDLVEICARKGVRRAVLSPGNRNAPLIVAFVEHPAISAYSIVDERSAAYTALGMAQQVRAPVALVCTSGSAALNLAPGVSEAFYLNVPLLVLTADRPPESVDQRDNQTIHQRGVYGDHVKFSCELPVDCTYGDALWHSHRLVNDALNVALTPPLGPVHINVPLREPFLPIKAGTTRFNRNLRVIEPVLAPSRLSGKQKAELRKTLGSHDRILLMGGQGNPDAGLIQLLERIQGEKGIPVMGDIISNLHAVKDLIGHPDLIFMEPEKGLCPDLLVTFGTHIISKSLKQFFRRAKPKEHWQVDTPPSADTLQSLTRIVHTGEKDFLRFLLAALDNRASYRAYGEHLAQLQAKAVKRYKSRLAEAESFTEFHAVDRILARLPDASVLHLGNSMPVRYAALSGLRQSNIEVFSNRGTSGIDGTLSTAVGHAVADPDRLHVLIIGDLGFFYDRNGLWRDSPPGNLRITLLNNGGGGIFSMIPGSPESGRARDFMLTRHRRNASLTAQEFNLSYQCVDSEQGLDKALALFFEGKDKPGILEISTSIKQNADLMHSLHGPRVRK